MKRIIAFIADLHLFSRYALFPPEFKTKQGQVITPSDGQKKIFNYFMEFVSTCAALDVDTVCILGDAIHGQNPIERGTLLISPDLDEQVDCGCDMIDLISHGRKLFMLSGSGYHRSAKGHNPEKDICDRLGGKYWGAIANVRFSPSQRIFNVQHGESAAFVYREMLLGRELLFLKYSEAMQKIPHLDARIQGHWHSYIHIHEQRVHMIQLPGWMAYEPSKPYLKSYGKMQPDIGGVIIKLDDDDRIIPLHFLMPEIPKMDGEVQSA